MHLEMRWLHLLSVIYSHYFSILVFTAASIIVLTAFTYHAIITSPWEDQHSLQDAFQSGSQLSDYMLDHFIVFVALLPPIFWGFLLTFAYSDTKTSLDWTLLILRVTSCACVAISLTVILTEHFSRRSIVAMAVLMYGSTGMLYSWSYLPCKWYILTFSKKGVIGYLPDSLQHILLRCSLMEWLSDRTVFEHMKAFLPFFLPLSENEQKLILRQLPRSTQKTICRPGMINFLPYGVQKALLPDLNEELLRVEYPLYKVQKCRELLTNAQVDLPAKSEMQVGFDFYKASALKLVRQGSAPPRQLDDVLYRILAGRLSRLPFALIPFARKQSLSKIASLSGTLLMLQLYFFPKTRHLVKSSLQLTSAMTLGSAVLFAIGMQSAPKCKSLYFLLSTFMRSFGRNRGYFLQKHGAENEVLWNKKVTSSVSLLLVIIYMVKKWRI